MNAKFQCEFCGNNFISKKQLCRHQKSAVYCLKKQGKSTTEFKCNYCDMAFSNIISLERHQKNTKYCLDIQDGIDLTGKRYTCPSCPKKFSRIDNYRRHVKTCSQKDADKKNDYVALRRDIDDVKRTINRDKKKDKMELLAEIKAITEQELKDCLEHLSLSFIKGGARGLANYANAYPFNEKVICSDRSRGKLKYRFDENDSITCDTGMLLSKKFFETIRDKSEELINKEYTSILEQINRLNYFNTSEMMIRATELQDTLRLCKDAANGNSNELVDDFLKYFKRLVP